MASRAHQPRVAQDERARRGRQPGREGPVVPRSGRPAAARTRQPDGQRREQAPGGQRRERPADRTGRCPAPTTTFVSEHEPAIARTAPTDQRPAEPSPVQRSGVGQVSDVRARTSRAAARIEPTRAAQRERQHGPPRPSERDEADQATAASRLAPQIRLTATEPRTSRRQVSLRAARSARPSAAVGKACPHGQRRRR